MEVQACKRDEIKDSVGKKFPCLLHRSLLSFDLGGFIWETGGSLGDPLPWRSIGVIELGENPRQNPWAQQLRGKILSRKELARIDRLLLTPLSLWL